MLSGLIVPYWFVLEGFKWNAIRAEALAPLNSRLPPLLSLRTFRHNGNEQTYSTKTLLRVIRRGRRAKASDTKQLLSSSYFLLLSVPLALLVLHSFFLFFWSHVVPSLLDFFFVLVLMLTYSENQFLVIYQPKLTNTLISRPIKYDDFLILSALYLCKLNIFEFLTIEHN